MQTVDHGAHTGRAIVLWCWTESHSQVHTDMSAYSSTKTTPASYHLLVYQPSNLLGDEEIVHCIMTQAAKVPPAASRWLQVSSCIMHSHALHGMLPWGAQTRDKHVIASTYYSAQSPPLLDSQLQMMPHLVFNIRQSSPAPRPDTPCVVVQSDCEL